VSYKVSGKYLDTFTIVSETKKKTETKKKNRKAVQISVKSDRRGARCLWRKRSFEIGKEE